MADNTRELEFILRFKNEADAALKAASVSLDGLGTSAQKTVKPLSDTTTGLDKTTKAAQGFTASAGELLGAFASLAAGLYGVSNAIGVFGDIEEGLNNVKTLVPDNTKLIDDWKGKLEELSITSGQSMAILTDGLYQTVSAFGEADNAFEIFNIANETAVAGTATTQESLSLLAASMKGYGDRTTEFANKVSNLAFIAAALGEATIPQMANSLGRVIPIAKAAGVAIEEVYAAMALVGTTGPTAAEVSTQLRATLVGLEKPTEEMAAVLKKLGVEGFQETKERIQKAGLQNFLRDIAAEALKSGGHITQLFSQVESWGFILALTETNIEDFEGALKKMSEEGGASGERAAAFAVQMDGVNRSLGRISAVLSVLKSRFGELFSGPVKGVSDFIVQFGLAFLQLAPSIQTVIAAVGGFIAIAVSLTPIVALIQSNWVALSGAFLSLLSPLRLVAAAFVGWPALVALALAGVAAAIWATAGPITEWGTWLQAFFQVTWEHVAGNFEIMKKVVGEFLTYSQKRLSEIFGGFPEAIRYVVTKIVELIQWAIGGLSTFVSDAFANTLDWLGEVTGVSGFLDEVSKRQAALQEYNELLELVATNADIAANGISLIGGGVEIESAPGEYKLPAKKIVPPPPKGGGGLSKEEAADLKRLSEAYEKAKVEIFAATAAHRALTKAYALGKSAVEEQEAVTEAFGIALQVGFQIYRDAEGVVRGKAAADTAGYEALKLLNDEARKGKKEAEQSKSSAEFNDDLTEQIGLMTKLVAAGDLGAEAYHDQKRGIEALNQLMKENSDITVDETGAVNDLTSATKGLSPANARRLKQIDDLMKQQEDLIESTDDLTAKYREGAPQGFFDGLKAGFTELNNAQLTLGELTQGLFQDTLVSGVDAVADALVTSKQSFADWSQSVLAEISKVLLKWLLMKAIMSGLNALSGAFTTGGAITGSQSGSGIDAGGGNDTFTGESFDNSFFGNFGEQKAQLSLVDVSGAKDSTYMQPAMVSVVHNNYAQGTSSETRQRKGPSGEDLIEIITRKVTAKQMESGAYGAGLDQEFRRRGVKSPGVHR